MFKNFIQRPVFAIVISVLILFVGGLAMKQLPTAQFPEIAPTTVNIFIAYPGASADVLTKSTIIQLETAINGVQGMRYLASDATSAGEGTIRVIFEPGTDPDEAVVRVKTRVDQVLPNLPLLVQREGVIITPVQPSMLMYVILVNRNAIRAAYIGANARQLQAVYAYEQTVLNAYVEVVNQLSNIQNLRNSYDLRKQQVDALSGSITISNNLFRSARADYMEVLLTQRDALESKFELVETQKQRMNAMVNMYQALGGGWR